MSLAFTSAGTVISISASLPATFDDNSGTGYPSLNYTEIGEVTDIPEFGKAFTLVTHNPLGNRQTVKRKGSFDNGSVTLQMARVPSDEGQEIAQDALESDDSYSFEVVLQDGTLQYFTAQVLSYTTNVGSVNQITAAAVQIEIDRDIVEIPAGS
jgi:hypothetical protein